MRILLVVTVSEIFNQKNVRMSVEDSLTQFAAVKELADRPRAGWPARVPWRPRSGVPTKARSRRRGSSR